MLSNLIEQIFGRYKCGKREIITTTIIEPESINIQNDSNPHIRNSSINNKRGYCSSTSTFSLSRTASESNVFKCNYEMQPQTDQIHLSSPRSIQQNDDNIRRLQRQQHLNNQNNIRNKQIKLNEISIFSVYLLFATLFVCICTIAVLLFTYINRANDIIQIRDSLTSEFIIRSDIDEIIRNVLKGIQNGDDVNKFRMEDTDSNPNTDSKNNNNKPDDRNVGHR